MSTAQPSTARVEIPTHPRRLHPLDTIAVEGRNGDLIVTAPVRDKVTAMTASGELVHVPATVDARVRLVFPTPPLGTPTQLTDALIGHGATRPILMHVGSVPTSFAEGMFEEVGAALTRVADLLYEYVAPAWLAAHDGRDVHALRLALVQVVTVAVAAHMDESQEGDVGDLASAALPWTQKFILDPDMEWICRAEYGHPAGPDATGVCLMRRNHIRQAHMGALA